MRATYQMKNIMNVFHKNEYLNSVVSCIIIVQPQHDTMMFHYSFLQYNSNLNVIYINCSE